MKRQRLMCLSPQGEFISRSGMSLEVQKLPGSANAGCFQLPNSGLLLLKLSWPETQPPSQEVKVL
jgi:hypothetical protein